MSFRDATTPQDLGPERLKPDQGTPILDPSVEAETWATDLCTGRAPHDVTRERILAWLAEGAREVTWALCWLPRERWTDRPPLGLDTWPVLRHVRHVAIDETHRILPAVRQALGEPASEPPANSKLELEQAEAAWDPAIAHDSAEELVQCIGETRFELLQRLESAPDDVWPTLDRLLLGARQHERQHLAAIWNIALNWDRASHTHVPGVPLHPADRLEESH